MFRHVIFIALAVGVSLAANAASKIRLVYDKNYRACLDVKKTLESSKVKSAMGGKYQLEFVEGKGHNDPPKDSLKMPCIYVVDEQGRCYFVFENVPYNYPGEKLIKTIDKVNSRRQEIEKGGMATADDCGKLLNSMEKFVGGPRRVVSPGFYQDVFNKLKQLDPKDDTGWVKHFTFGDQFDKNNQKDGLEYVIEANYYRQGQKGYSGNTVRQPDPAAGKKWIDRELEDAQTRIKEKRNHLTPEQLQGLFMAKFEAYRDDNSKREENLKLLRRVASFDETTFWGTAACGWLNWLGEPPLSVYWGWRKGDFKGSNFSVPVKYGADYAFTRPGKYKITFQNDSGTLQTKINSVSLMIGDEPYLVLSKPTVQPGGVFEFDATVKSDAFGYNAEREYKCKFTALLVKGDAPQDGGSTGKIRVERQILKPRKVAK